VSLTGSAPAPLVSAPETRETPSIAPAVRPWFERALPFFAPLALLALWQLATVSGFVSRQVLIPPAQVLATFIELSKSGELAGHLSESLVRLGLGFALGGTLGLGFGVAMGLSKRVEEYAAPIFQAVRQIPSIALIPAFILIFGVEETFKIVLIVKACFFPVALAALNGVKDIPRHFLEVGAVYRLPRWAMLKLVVLPAILPPIVAGVRISLGRSWIILVAAELMAADRGIGQMMEMGRQMFRLDVVMVGVFMTGVIGLGLDTSVRLAERSMSRWRQP
jgi:sulfonate transport system permease protein